MVAINVRTDLGWGMGERTQTTKRINKQDAETRNADLISILIGYFM